MGWIRNNLATIVAGIMVAAVLVGTTVAFGPWSHADASSLMVVIHDGDGGTQSLPLSQDDVVSVSTSLGNNTVTIKDGVAFMSEADCAGGDCMRQASISQPGQQLICLPHQLWVEIVELGSAGTTQLDTHAVTWQADKSDGQQDFSADVDLVAQ